MRNALAVVRTSIGKKFLMAVTGLLLFLFVVGHLLGNLKVFQGPEKYNAYAEGLRTVGAPFLGHGEFLWIARIGLLVAVAVHIVAAIQLTRLSRAARPVGYARDVTPVASTYASRTMRWGGVLIALYVVYHLLHLTFGSAHPDFVAGSVYHNVIVGFQAWPVSAVYIVAMVVLGFHLYHGIWSSLQTLSINHSRYERLRRPVAALIAGGIVLGYVSIPAAVLAGVLS